MSSCNIKLTSLFNIRLHWICVLVLITGWVVNSEKSYYDFRMPNVRTNEDDAYLCYAEDFGRNRTFITAFEALRDKEVTHHMILFSCKEPGSMDPVWHCGDSTSMTPVCEDGSKIIFSWAMEAPDFELPPNTSLPIGGYPNRYLVLQVHYKDAAAFAKSPEKKDRSGFRLTLSSKPTGNVGGVYLLASNQDVPANANSSIEVACTYTGQAVLHPFAFRVHAHSHGVVNEGFVIHNGNYYLIGAKSPQEPQTFYPTPNQTLEVHQGDILTARCNMTNNENRVIHMGHTRKDEMCNFYIMYSVPLADIDQLDEEENQGCNSDIPTMDEMLQEMNNNILGPISRELVDDMIMDNDYNDDDTAIRDNVYTPELQWASDDLWTDD